ncbi:addiction module toxin RelE [Streptomyces sp. YC419]|uniref:Addiction module toxin RelE n=1 Tax=Streptomyces ureilyticus TaxID=1775131 RepID=A0ABX0DQP7_9ACTN|nr:addiction module toxin RelE [Streptomyces ureilyticus]
MVRDSVELLADQGPMLGRPAVDRIHGSQLHNLKELRPGSSGRSEIRILFLFDVKRQAVLLVAGDKAGNWQGWYPDAIKLAEERYDRCLENPGRRSIE